MYRSLGLAVIGSLILTPCFSPGADKRSYVELEAPRFDGGTLDNQLLPALNTRFSAFNSAGTLVAATCRFTPTIGWTWLSILMVEIA